MKREEGGRRRSPQGHRVPRGDPRARSLGRVCPPPGAPPFRPRSRAFGVDPGEEARADFVPVTRPPAPPSARARAGAGTQAREAQRARGPAQGLHDGGASGRRRRAAAASSCRPLGSGAGPGPAGGPGLRPRPGARPGCQGRRRRRRRARVPQRDRALSLRDPTLYPARVGALKRRRPAGEAERAELQVSAPGPPAPPARPGPASPAAAACAAILEQWPPGRRRAGGDDAGREPGEGRPRGGRRREGGRPARPPGGGGAGPRACWKWERAGRRKVHLGEGAAEPRRRGELREALGG